MGLLKHKKELMLAVKYFLFLGTTFLIINCNSLKKVETSNNLTINVLPGKFKIESGLIGK